MPTVRVETNLGPEFFPEGFMPMFIVAVADLLGKDRKAMKYVCHQAGSPLSPLMAATAGVKTSATTATSAAFQETPALHCGQHPLV